MKLQFESLGLSIATYEEGYVSLAEEALQQGVMIKNSGNAGPFSYFVFQPVPEFEFWACCQNDEMVSFVPFYSRGSQVNCRLTDLFGFESSPARSAVKTHISVSPDKSFYIYPELVNAVIIKNQAAIYARERPARIILNAYLNLETAAIYKNEGEYIRKHDDHPAISAGAIAAFKSISTDETPAELMPYAHMTAEIIKVEKAVNGYSREFFKIVEVRSNCMKFQICVKNSGAGNVDIFENISAGSILEGDAYFAAKLQSI